MADLQHAPATPETAHRPPELTVPDIEMDAGGGQRPADLALAAGMAPGSGPPRGALPPGAMGAAALLGIQRFAGNRAAATLAHGTRAILPPGRRAVARPGDTGSAGSASAGPSRTREPGTAAVEGAMAIEAAEAAGPGAQSLPVDALHTGGSAPDRARPALQRLALQRNGQPASQQDLQDVVDLMPIMPAIDNLVSVTEAECGRWKAWRGTFDGPVPGSNAYIGMSQFKDTVLGQGFNYFDERIQKILRRRLTGDNRQALTEMYCFAVGSGQGAKGDFAGLGKVFGVQAGRFTHKYTIKIGYSIGVKGKLGIGVGYTYRSGAIQYDNDFGMTYNKPLNMSSLVASFGPGADAKIKGKSLASVGSIGLESTASTESMSFWMPDDWETEFQVVKVAAGAQAGLKVEAKILELVRVSSDKHPPVLFDLMGGKMITHEESVELGVGAGGGADIEYGVMVGGKDVGEVTASAPALEEARKKAQESKLIPPDEEIPQWRVVDAGTVSFPTGSAEIPGDGYKPIVDLAKRVAAWVGEHPGCDVQFEIIGQASPRWSHPKKGQIPTELNHKLSVERAKNTRGALEGAWWSTGSEATCTFQETGCEGPALELTEDRARTEGKGSLRAVAEGADKDNNDQGYRVAVITVSGKPAPTAPSQ